MHSNKLNNLFNNILDTDLSNLPKPKNTKLTEEDTNKFILQEDKKFIKDLDIFQSNNKLLSVLIVNLQF